MPGIVTPGGPPSPPLTRRWGGHPKKKMSLLPQGSTAQHAEALHPTIVMTVMWLLPNTAAINQIAGITTDIAGNKKTWNTFADEDREGAPKEQP